MSRETLIDVVSKCIVKSICDSIHHFVDGGFLVARSGHDVLVVRRNVAAEHRRRFFRLEKKKKKKKKKKK